MTLACTPSVGRPTFTEVYAGQYSDGCLELDKHVNHKSCKFLAKHDIENNASLILLLVKPLSDINHFSAGCNSPKRIERWMQG